MKKYFTILSILLITLFIGAVKANAYVFAPENQEDICHSVSTTGQECTLKIIIDSKSSFKQNDEVAEVYFTQKINKDTGDKNPYGIVDNKITLTAGTNFLINGESSIELVLSETEEVKVTIKYVGADDLVAGTYDFAVATYDKDDSYTDGCGFAYNTKNAPVCGVVTSAGVDYYFDSKGNGLGSGDEAKEAYLKDCFQCKKDIDGEYRNSKGEKVTEEEYFKDCYSCKKPEESDDGKYHGKNGEVITEEQYKKDCMGVCRIENDKYYCLKAEECTKEDYENQCTSPSKTGAFLPIAGIIAGVGLIIVSTVMVKKQTKLRKI